MDKRPGIEHLLYPKSISVHGASRTPGKVGHAILQNILSSGFDGKVIPVNPAAGEILGIKSLPSLKGLDGEIDLCVIAVPPPSVMDSLKDAIRAGAKAAVVITAGFRETGAEGEKLEKEIASLCAANDVRLLGPNCLGFINTHYGLNASFARQTPKPGGISVISQSGALCTAILDWAVGRHLGLAKMISIGNKADLGEVDFLRYLKQDPDTRVIICYLESISSGKGFVRAAEETCSEKPVVILKAGTTSSGIKAASSHTGSLSGADIAYGAAFRRSGIIRAETFESLFDHATALSMQPLPKGRRVAIITNAGGPGIMAADAVESLGMRVASLSGSTADDLRKNLPRAASVGNPIDVLGDADPGRYAMAVTAALKDDSVDAVMVILTPQAMTSPAETARAVSERAGDTGKPLLASFMGGADVIPGRKELAAANLPDYPSPERAAAALKGMCEYAEWRDRPPRMVMRFPVNRSRVERIISRHSKTGQTRIMEVHAKELLKAYGFAVPPGQAAATADEAAEAASAVGYPVAMKIVSPDVLHKSDIGGVKLNLSNGEAVRDAFDLMMMRVRKKAPAARLEGVYVEKMSAGELEVIIGMSRDAQFGPMLMFGLGGIFVEVMKDVTFHLAPITADEAMQMLKSTRSYELLKGARGQSGVDMDSIAEGLQRISQLATDFPQIIELDINPFIVGGPGKEPVVADARITLSGGGGRE